MIEIAKGWVSHSRTGNIKNSFKYPVFYFRFDIKSENSVKTFLAKKFPFFAIDKKCYLSGDGQHRLDSELREFLLTNFDFVPDSVQLQTIPKIFGYCFNPISFWFCYQNKKLMAVLCEVNNTFGERHFYWINDESLERKEWSSTKKQFHVSPFFPVKGSYKFKFVVDVKHYKIDINYFDESGELLLSTWVQGEYQPLRELNQRRLILKYGWISLIIIFRIHYQALKLWLKGATFHKSPKNRKSMITK